MILKRNNFLLIIIATLFILSLIWLVSFHSQNNYAHAYTLNEKKTFSIEMKKGIAANSASQTKAVQQRLKYIGLYNDSIDGSYGPNTKAAVKKFQSRNGLAADGSAGPATTAKLRSSVSVKGKAATYGYYLFHTYPTYFVYIGTSSTGP